MDSDRYFQIVKCFRDEDLRADRQPEFTQIDCELSFVDRNDILEIFESFTKTLFLSVLDVQLEDFQRMPYDEAIEKYGSDKPDLRFDMPIHEMKALLPKGGLSILDEAESIGALLVKGGNDCTRKTNRWPDGLGETTANWSKRAGFTYAATMMGLQSLQLTSSTMRWHEKELRLA